MSASKLIDKQIAELPDWRGKTITKLRKIIHEADPEIAEEWKWNTAVFSHNGLVVAVGAFKGNVKMNFFQGANLPDPASSSIQGSVQKKREQLTSMKPTRSKSLR